MAYKVIKKFIDLKDGNRIYNVGDSFPHDGLATEARLRELSTSNNRRKEPLIVEVNEEESEEDVSAIEEPEKEDAKEEKEDEIESPTKQNTRAKKGGKKNAD